MFGLLLRCWRVTCRLFAVSGFGLNPVASPTRGDSTVITMASAEHPRFTIIGGGLGGALMAAYLGRGGYEVDVYERRPDPTGGEVVGGRSINLAISVRGIHALGEVGLADEILNVARSQRQISLRSE